MLASALVANTTNLNLAAPFWFTHLSFDWAVIPMPIRAHLKMEHEMVQAMPVDVFIVKRADVTSLTDK